MNFFAVMNGKLDEGWKVTDIACTICKGTVMVNPSLTEYFCVRCNKPAVIAQDDEENDSDDYDRVSDSNKGKSEENKQNLKSTSANDSGEKKAQKGQESQYEYATLQNEVLSRMNKPDPSKRLGELLLEGWMMLGDSCPQCETMPLMKSRKQEYLCVACDKFFNPPNDKNKSGQSKQQSTSTKTQPSQQAASQQVQKPIQESSAKSQNIPPKSASQDASSRGQQQSTGASFQSANANASKIVSNVQQAQPKSNVASASKEDMQFDPNFFEANLENYRTLMGLINKASNDLSRKLETSPCDENLIGNIVRLIDAQTQIDRSQLDLIRTVYENSQ